jgi:hypothetical protein
MTLATTLVLMTSGNVGAGTPDDAKRQGTDAEQATRDAPAAPVSQQALRVYVDPVTGRRSAHPTAEQRAASAATDRANPAFSTSAEGLRSEVLPGGGVLVHLDGRFQSAVVVKRGADGRLTQACTDPSHGAEGHGHAAATVVREDR